MQSSSYSSMAVNLSKKQIKKFQTYILDWYMLHKRDFPWRKTRDPYKILVSEVMSQQTQIGRVVPKYVAWMKVFPTVEHLAHASVRDVLTLWSGLGYNRRALYLKKCAGVISSRARNLKGISPHFVRRDDKYWYWPQTEKELMQLSGIGKYTARAIMCFAFNQQVAVVDTNVKKVLLTQFVYPSSKSIRYQVLRIMDNQTKRKIHNTKYMLHTTGEKAIADISVSEKEIEQLADMLLPPHRAYEWNQALMDYASAMLKHEIIPVPKQSKFKDSDRFYRGQIIKLLLADGKEQRKEIFKVLSQKYGLKKDRFDNVVETLLADKLIVTDSKQLLALP